LYFIAGAVWLFYYVRYRETLLGLQHFVTVVLAVGFAESVLWMIDYLMYNASGEISDVNNIIGALLTSGKLTLCRALLLLVAYGYSILKPELTMKTRVLFATITSLYGVAAAGSKYMTVLRGMTVSVPYLFDVVFGLLETFLNTFFIVYTAMELYRNMKFLLEKKQEAKLSLYRKLAWFLGIFVAVCLLFTIGEFAMAVGGYRDEWWTFTWMFEAVWDVGYFIAIVLIGYLWKPSANNAQYAYSMQLSQDDTAEPMDNVRLSDSEDDRVDEVIPDDPMSTSQGEVEVELDSDGGD
jgi:hypothetical protein